MGNHNQRLIRGRSQERKDKMLLKLFTSATILSLAVGAPQYGGVQPTSPVKTAPLTGSVKCRTDYVTLWDTEYKETETQVCTTEYEKVCRSAAPFMRSSARRCTRACVWSSTRPSTSPTQRLSAPHSTRMTVSTNGKAMAMTRSGLP